MKNQKSSTDICAFHQKVGARGPLLREEGACDVFLKKIDHFIEANSLLKSSGKYLVALSGGADSVCLLVVLKMLKYNVEAVHCNFKLRGEESFRDEQFCEELCKTYDITLHKVHFDTASFASLHKISIELAARELRYGYFEQLRNDVGADAVCVAHHSDDNAETVLLNLFRGTGLRGLTGIRAKNGTIVRPLLCTTRHEIECFLEAQGQDYVTDSTNKENVATRNIIRNVLMPVAEDVNPAAKQHINNAASMLAEISTIVDQYKKTSFDDILLKENEIDISRLLEHQASRFLLYELLSQYDFNPAQIQQIYSGLRGQSGRTWQSPTHVACIDRDRLIVRKTDEFDEPFAFRVPEAGRYIIRKTAFTFRLHDVDDNFTIPVEPDCVAVDADKVGFPLVVRSVKAGDRFVPFGMKGCKLLSDYMTDIKMSVFDKHDQMVVTLPDDRIVWAVKLRIDDRFRITSETRRALVITAD